MLDLIMIIINRDCATNLTKDVEVVVVFFIIISCFPLCNRGSLFPPCFPCGPSGPTRRSGAGWASWHTEVQYSRHMLSNERANVMWSLICHSITMVIQIFPILFSWYSFMKTIWPKIYTEWPRKNATYVICNFNNVDDKMLVLFISLCRICLSKMAPGSSTLG